MNFEKELEVARRAARSACELAISYQKKGVTAESKADESPVTIADRESEKLIASILSDSFPDDGLLGEEGAGRPSRNGRTWIIDPIDGTRDFARGSSLWSVLIGLEQDGEVVAGVVHLPGTNEQFYASRGGGAFCDGEPIHVSSKQTAAESVLFFNGLRDAHRREFAPRLVTFMGRFWAVRSMSGAPDAMLVASGRADVWVEPAAKPWDLAPIKVIVEEAGGKFFNFEGGSSIHAGNCVVCTPALEPEVHRFISGEGY